jgi:NCAIR mutase (PurE)-related protein
MKQEKDFQDLGYAKVDYGREKRQGQPEVIYAAGKTKEQVCGIFKTLLEKNHGCVLATRATAEQYAYVQERIPAVQYDEAARAHIYGKKPAGYHEGPALHPRRYGGDERYSRGGGGSAYRAPLRQPRQNAL